MQTKEDQEDIETRISEIMAEKVQPAVARDGGYAEFVKYESGTAYIRLAGACGSCPSSQATLKSGIQKLLNEEIPEVTEVEQIY